MTWQRTKRLRRTWRCDPKAPTLAGTVSLTTANCASSAHEQLDLKNFYECPCKVDICWMCVETIPPNDGGRLRSLGRFQSFDLNMAMFVIILIGLTEYRRQVPVADGWLTGKHGTCWKSNLEAGPLVTWGFKHLRSIWFCYVLFLLCDLQ